MYLIRETNKSYTAKFNDKYTLVFSHWIEDLTCPESIYFKLRINETGKFIDLPQSIQSLLKPIIRETKDYQYFIEYNSKEYIRIELAINLIKLIINF